MREVTLRPGFSRNDAIGRIQSRLRELRFGKLRAVIGVQVPYDVFDVIGTLIAIDAINGSLDLYGMDDRLLSKSDESAKSGTIQRQLSLSLTRSCLEKRLARQGKPRQTVTENPVATVLVPYWVGIFERDGAVHIEVLDAIRGSLEGGKMRDVIEESLTRRREDAKQKCGT